MKNNNGFILINVVIIIGISSALVLVSSNELIQHTRIISNQSNYTQCFYRADAALMQFRKTLINTPGFAINSSVINFDGVVVEIEKNNKRLTAKAKCKNSGQALGLTITDITKDEINPQWSIL